MRRSGQRADYSTGKQFFQNLSLCHERTFFNTLCNRNDPLSRFYIGHHLHCSSSGERRCYRHDNEIFVTKCVLHIRRESEGVRKNYSGEIRLNMRP